MHVRTLTIASAIAMLVAAAGGASSGAPPLQRGPTETGPGSLAAARRYLEGRWGLISFDVFPPGQPPIQVKGGGTLTYDAFGNLDVQIRVDRATAALLEDAGIPITD